MRGLGGVFLFVIVIILGAGALGVEYLHTMGDKADLQHELAAKDNEIAELKASLAKQVAVNQEFRTALEIAWQTQLEQEVTIDTLFAENERLVAQKANNEAHIANLVSAADRSGAAVGIGGGSPLNGRSPQLTLAPLPNRWLYVLGLGDVSRQEWQLIIVTLSMALFAVIIVWGNGFYFRSSTDGQNDSRSQENIVERRRVERDRPVRDMSYRQS